MMRYKTMENRSRMKRQVIFFLFLVSLLGLVSLLAPYLIPNDPYTTNALYRKGPPNLTFPFGTDKLGRCIFSRVIMGTRTSVFSALMVVAVSLTTGTAFGIISGYYGGLLDRVIMGICDIFLAFPQMVLAIGVAGLLGGNMTNAILALTLTGWTSYARLSRGLVMTMKKETYISAARLSGSGNIEIMLEHIFPGIAGELIVNATLQISAVMIGFAGLSYLGIGVSVPEAEWGSMISEAIGYMQQAPWAVMAPGAALFITVFVFQLLGDSLRDYFGVGRGRYE
jgi:peptide/nickel transport system permease protein